MAVYGNDNVVEISASCKFRNTTISVIGNNNRLIVDERVRFLGPCTITLMNNSTLHIGVNAGIRGVDILCSGASIEIGERCMFSYGIHIRNTDSHRVIDPATGLATNEPRDIRLGEHVWIGQNASILKGVDIGSDSIVAYGAVVTRGCPPGSVLAGNPARIVKEDINWDY